MTMPPQNQNPGYGQSSSQPGYGQNQPGYDQGSGYNPAPGTPGHTHPGGAVPKPVQMLKTLAIVRLALVVINAIVGYFASTALVDYVARQTNQQVPGAAGSSLMGTILGLLIGLAIAGFLYFCAMQVAAHKNWARIVTAVFAIISLCIGLPGLLGIPTLLSASPLWGGLTALLGIIGLIVAGLTVANAFNKETTAWANQ